MEKPFDKPLNPFTDEPWKKCPDKIEPAIVCESKAEATQTISKDLARAMAAPPKLYGHPKFYQIMEELKQLHSDKNHDYAGTDDPLRNLKACSRIQVCCPKCGHTHGLEPWIGVLIRLQDKISRLESLAGADPKVKGESILDTLNDTSVYAILGRILKESENED